MVTFAHDHTQWHTHTHTHTHTVGLLRTKDRPVAKTSTWQHTTLTRQTFMPRRDSHAQSSKRVAADLRLKPRGHWDRHLFSGQLQVTAPQRIYTFQLALYGSCEVSRISDHPIFRETDAFKKLLFVLGRSISAAFIRHSFTYPPPVNGFDFLVSTYYCL
jgi:hypothetical protein